MKGKLLGIDFGTKNVGIAVSDEGAALAFPRAVLAREKELTDEIKKICDGEGIREIVVGASFNLKGEPNPLMREIAPFVAELKKECGADVFLEPEFFTSAQAARFRKGNNPLDASAAALILQSFLDKRREREKQKNE